MGKRAYEEYIKNDCHPVGYNEPCQSYLFGQTSVDLLLDRIGRLKQQLTEKDKEIEYLNHKIDIEEPCLVRNYKDMIEQLKQSQTQLAIQELEKIKDYFILEHEDGSLDITKNEFEIAEYLIKKIKELKGEI